MKLLKFLACLLLPLGTIYGQQSSIQVRFLFDGKPISLEQNYFHSSVKDSISFDAIRCYFSQIIIKDSKDKTIELDKKHFLVDAENPNSCVIHLPKPIKISEINLNVGVDSTSNANAIMTGDLDPINGMYWAWQSGFINWKIEGRCNSLTTRNHVFQYHIGGFLAPFQSTRSISLVNSDSSKKVQMDIDLKSFFDKINLLETNELMSPSEKSNAFSHIFSSLFYLSHE